MKIVFLDRKSIGDDIDLSKFESYGEVVNYDFTYPKEVPKRASDADILIVNKTLINEQTIHFQNKGCHSFLRQPFCVTYPYSYYTLRIAKMQCKFVLHLMIYGYKQSLLTEYYNIFFRAKRILSAISPALLSPASQSSFDDSFIAFSKQSSTR